MGRTDRGAPIANKSFPSELEFLVDLSHAVLPFAIFSVSLPHVRPIDVVVFNQAFVNRAVRAFWLRASVVRSRSVCTEGGNRGKTIKARVCRIVEVDFGLFGLTQHERI